MKVSKTPLLLSVLVAFLVLIASASGIFLKSIYARETPSGAVQGVGQDIVNLVAVVVLLIAAHFVNKGSVKAFLVWSGVLLYLLYTYVIYAFDVHFNSLFLVYVAILGLSFYALVGSVTHIHLNDLSTTFSAHTKARAVSDNLRTHIDVPLTVAILGGETHVATPDGHRLLLRIPPETGNGRVFRLRGQGMPHLGQPEQRGDLFAEVTVVLPKQLTDEQRRLFEVFARSVGYAGNTGI